MYQEWKKLKKRYKLGIVMIPVGLVFFLSGGWASMLVKAETQVLDVTWGEGTAFDRPLQVTLRAGVNREVALVTQPPVPLVELERVVEVGLTGFEYRISLKPLESWEPGVRYRVVAQVDKVDVASTATVDVPKLSEPTLTGVTNETSRCLQAFTYDYGELNGVVEVQAALTPAHEVAVTILEEGVLIDPVGCLLPSTQYSLTLTHRLKGSSAEFVAAVSKEFTTSSGTAVAEVANPSRHAAGKPDGVKVTFTADMNQDSVVPSISKGSVAGSWLDAKTYLMTLSGLAAGESYQISFADAKDSVGDPVAIEPIAVQTYGAVSATLGPSGSKVGVDAQLTVAFDQPVDQAQAQQLVGVSPEVAFSTNWVGNKLILTPKEPLKKGTSYSLYVLPGVPSTIGLPSAKKLIHSFTTEPNSVQLGVVFDRQDRKLSCEVASLKMALKVKGVYVSEDELMGHVGYVTQDARGETWGNPHLGFVGSIDGKQNSTGYGVYWDPIASAANHYRPSYARTGMTVQELAAAIDAGHPVVTWGVYPGGKKDGWFTPEGTWIEAWVGEHVRVVGGYEGSVDNPTSFTVIDPVSGVQVWSTKKLLADWATFGNAGVIVK